MSTKKAFILDYSRKIFICIIVTLTWWMCFQAREAFSHDLWLNISSHQVLRGEGLKIFLGWGHHYPFSDFLDPARLDSMAVIAPNGDKFQLTPQKGVPGTPFNPQMRGTYLVEASMKPGYYTKTLTGHTYKSKKESKDVISSVWYEKYAKATFCVEGPGGKTYEKGVDHTLEIIPVDDPCALAQGDTLKVRVLFKGKPLAKTFIYGGYLGFPDANAFSYATRTDAKGMAHIRLIRPGVWRLMVQHIEPPKDPELCDALKYTAFFTFSVR